jgi:hypothetical protein
VEHGLVSSGESKQRLPACLPLCPAACPPLSPTRSRASCVSRKTPQAGAAPGQAKPPESTSVIYPFSSDQGLVESESRFGLVWSGQAGNTIQRDTGSCRRAPPAAAAAAPNPQSCTAPRFTTAYANPWRGMRIGRLLEDLDSLAGSGEKNFEEQDEKEGTVKFSVWGTFLHVCCIRNSEPTPSRAATPQSPSATARRRASAPPTW